MQLTIAPFSINFSKICRPDPLKNSVTSFNLKGFLKSGLSHPNCSILSLNVNVGKGRLLTDFCFPLNLSKTSNNNLLIISKTSSCVAKLISISI